MLQAQDFAGYWGESRAELVSIHKKTPELDKLHSKLKSVVLPLLEPLACDYSLLFPKEGFSEESAVPILFVYLDIEFVEILASKIPSSFSDSIRVGEGARKLNDDIKGYVEEAILPQIGSSIGSRGATATGSLGWFVKSKSDGKVYALTCANAVEPDSEVQCPATNSLLYSISITKSHLQSYKALLSNEMAGGAEESRIASLQDAIDEWTALFDRQTNVDTHLGKVVMWHQQFGLNKRDQTVWQDVALIEVAKDKIQEDMNGNICELDDFIEDHTGRIVMNCGSTNQQGYGHVQAYPAEHVFTACINGTDVTKHIVTPTIFCHKHFAETGESGAMLCSRVTQYAIGLLNGTHSRSRGSSRIGYFISIEDVLDICESHGFHLEPF